MDYNMILENIKLAYQSILQDNLIGIYIHGSIALGCFHWDKSDIDFIVVVREPLSIASKHQIIQVTMEQNELAPPKGIEMSVVLAKHCQFFQYPTPFELHFSNMHRNWFHTDPEGYCEKMNGLDKDLAAHFTIINKAGLVLCGPAISEVFEAVPKEDYIDSIKADIEDAGIAILENTMYVVLTLCRVVAYIKFELILSKEQGGEWGLEHLDGKYHEMLKRALYCYRTKEEMSVDKKEAEEYSGYMLKQILV